MKLSKYSHLIYCLVLVAITCFLYASLFSADFVEYDDQIFVHNYYTAQPMSFHNLKDIFTTRINDGYAPLTSLSFNLENAFFGNNPHVFHFFNVALHIVIVLLIYHLVGLLNFSAATAFLSALIFAIHPVHVESVAWISQRKDVLYSTFFLISIIQYLYYQKSGSGWNYRLSYICGLLSMLSKPMAISLPIVLLLLDWWNKRSFTKKVFIEKIPYMFYTFLLGLIELPNLTYDQSLTFLKSLFVFVYSFTFYLQKIFNLCSYGPFYDLPEAFTLNDPTITLSVLTMVLFILLLVRYRKNRLWIFACAFYVVTIAVVLKVEISHTNVVSDRYFYLPSLGFCIFLAYHIGKLYHYFKINLAFQLVYLSSVFILFIMFGLNTYWQCFVWKNDFTFWNYVIHSTNSRPEGYSSRGAWYRYHGDHQKAMADFNRAIKINKLYPNSYFNRGYSYDLAGRWQEALDNYTQAIDLGFRSASALNNRGIIYIKNNQYELALNDFEKAIGMEPKNSQTLNNLGVISWAMGHHRLAQSFFTQSLEIDPTDKSVTMNRDNISELLEISDGSNR